MEVDSEVTGGNSPRPESLTENEVQMPVMVLAAHTPCRSPGNVKRQKVAPEVSVVSAKEFKSPLPPKRSCQRPSTSSQRPSSPPAASQTRQENKKSDVEMAPVLEQVVRPPSAPQSEPTPQESLRLQQENSNHESVPATTTVEAPASHRCSSLMTEESGTENDIVSPLPDEEPSSTLARPSPKEVLEQTHPIASTPAPGLIGSTLSRLTQRNTPWSSSAGPSWLSRLGWFNNNNNQQQQQQHAKKSLKSENPMPTATGGKLTKPLSASRLPHTGRLNKTIGPHKTNISVIAETSILSVNRASGQAHRVSTNSRVQAVLTKKLSTAEERRQRVLAESAAQKERQRKLEQQKEEERRARARAMDAHRQAVRANAERVAQEKQAARARKIEAEMQRMQKLKEKPLTAKTSMNSQPAASLIKPLAPISTNVPSSTQFASSISSSSNNSKYIKNFDYASSAATMPANATSQGQPQPVAKKESLISYDLSGVLSDYNSDSEEENRRKKKPIPSWAKPGSAELLQWVSKVYQGELRWQNVFRPAESVHFDDADLFHGFKFRSRPRGSSAVWREPPQIPR
ncbi:unnamed protein product [Mesocestoides corti]|uniref:Inner centromere protein ARK-binding domain-containing protein n=1 Tax=Mesocestoides corti TaxID=53468 RepID=A0A158QSG2_MESCO|nr:unnamed protein product [Mesocestoides corti]